MITALKEIPNETLVIALKTLKGKENVTQAQFIRYLAEVEERKLYRELGYSSLFNYCTEGLGYPANEAYLRVQTAKCLKSNPNVYDLIKNGKISVSAVAEIEKIKIQSVKAEIIDEAIRESKTKLKAIDEWQGHENKNSSLESNVLELCPSLLNISKDQVSLTQ